MIRNLIPVIRNINVVAAVAVAGILAVLAVALGVCTASPTANPAAAHAPTINGHTLTVDGGSLTWTGSGWVPTYVNTGQ